MTARVFGSSMRVEPCSFESGILMPRAAIFARGLVTSLAPVARVRRVPGSWPTPTVTDSARSRNATVVRSRGAGKHHAGVTLTDALILSGDLAMPEGGGWPSGRKYAGPKRPSPGTRQCPRWTEWLMGFPLGWTEL